MLHLTLLLLAAPSLTLRADDQGLALLAAGGQVASIAYHAAAGERVLDSAAAQRRDGRLTVGLSQPDARLTGLVTDLPRGVRVDWTVQAPAGEWGGGLRQQLRAAGRERRGASGDRLDYAHRGRPYEVPGDTPYPDTECQVRVLRFGEQALVMVSSTYDPDWFYSGEFARTRTAQYAPPADGTPATMALTWLWVPAAETRPLDAVVAQRFASEAAGRPVALSVGSGRVGSVFALGDPIASHVWLSNTTDQFVSGTLDLEVFDYRGERLLGATRPFELGPRQTREVVDELAPQQQGILSVKAGVRWDGGRYDTRATIGVLPERQASAPDPSSPFGMAAIIAAPERYADQFDDATVLAAMARIGVRWCALRLLPPRRRSHRDDREAARRAIAELASFGMSCPHPDRPRAGRCHLPSTSG